MCSRHEHQYPVQQVGECYTVGSASRLFRDMWAGIIKSNTTHQSASVINADGKDYQRLKNVIESHSTPQSWFVVQCLYRLIALPSAGTLVRRQFQGSRDATLWKRSRARFLDFIHIFAEGVMHVVSKDLI
jgi:hypothetical protein